VSKTTVVLVGGFLGAGKTTLLWEAAKRLATRGLRAGLITNDQAPDLVDSGLLAHQGLAVQEVAGSCFCCNFPGLVKVAENLQQEAQADVLLAEPVGSCTDLSATVLQPLKALYGESLHVAPYSVLLDPARARVLTEPGSPGDFAANVQYIFRKQIEEADTIVLNKADLLSQDEVSSLMASLAEQFPGRRVLAVSALKGDGLDEWLDTTLSGGPAGQRIVEVDYQVYADGEAALGWLNASVALHAERETDWQTFCQDLVAHMRQHLAKQHAAVAHLKLLLNTPSGDLVVNLTSSDGLVAVRGAAQPEREALLTINARVQTDPDSLRRAVTDSLTAASGTRISPRIKRLAAFAPSPPRPTHRFGKVIGQSDQ
jgi:G3E family GTPase